MKTHSLNHASDSASGRALLKAVRHHSPGTKTDPHRYERRKVRELLRHAEVADEAAFDSGR